MFLQGITKGNDGLFQPRRSALALSEARLRESQIVLYHCPLKRCALAGDFLEHIAKPDNGLFELRRAALALSEPMECKAQLVLDVGAVDGQVRRGPETYQPFVSFNR